MLQRDATDETEGPPADPLKVLRAELAASLGTDRFLREIEIAAKLTHPNILALHDCGEADGQLYYMERACAKQREIEPEA
jgi:serine/threonine-protein kinase